MNGVYEAAVVADSFIDGAGGDGERGDFYWVESDGVQIADCDDRTCFGKR